jgi:CRP-like cAMP-binding protein
MAQSDKRLVSLLGAEWQAFSAKGEPRTFAAGAVIFSAGEPGDGLHLVQAGRVRIAADVSATEARTLAVVEPGDSFGEMAVLDDAPRSATATAEVDTTTLFLSRDVFLGLLEQHPRLAMGLLRELSARMRALNQK